MWPGPAMLLLRLAVLWVIGLLPSRTLAGCAVLRSTQFVLAVCAACGTAQSPHLACGTAGTAGPCCRRHLPADFPHADGGFAKCGGWLLLLLLLLLHLVCCSWLLFLPSFSLPAWRLAHPSAAPSRIHPPPPPSMY
jgi:hypothetical protein